MTGSSYRSTKTNPSTRSSGRPTAATEGRTSAYPTCGVGHPSTPAEPRGQASLTGRSAPEAEAQTETLTTSQIPPHGHMVGSWDQATATSPSIATGGNNVLASRPRRGSRNYTAPDSLTALLGGPAATGGGQAHENVQPFLVLRFVIALVGLFPSRN